MRPARVRLRPLAIALAAGLALSVLVAEAWRLATVDDECRFCGGLIAFIVVYATVGIGVARHSGWPRILVVIAVAAGLDAALFRGAGRVPVWIPLGAASLTPILIGLIASRGQRPQPESIPEAPDTTCSMLLRNKRLRTRIRVAKVDRSRPSPLPSLWDYWMDG